MIKPSGCCFATFAISMLILCSTAKGKIPCVLFAENTIGTMLLSSFASSGTFSSSILLRFWQSPTMKSTFLTFSSCNFSAKSMKFSLMSTPTTFSNNIEDDDNPFGELLFFLSDLNSPSSTSITSSSSFSTSGKHTPPVPVPTSIAITFQLYRFAPFSSSSRRRRRPNKRCLLFQTQK